MMVAWHRDGSPGPEMTDLARSLQALLDAIERAEMTASTAMAYRLEGAVTALEGVLGTRPSGRVDLSPGRSESDLLATRQFPIPG